MGIMGLASSAYWIALFTIEVLTTSVLCLMLAVVSQACDLFDSGTIGQVFLLLLCYTAAMVPWLALQSTFFTRPQSAGQVTKHTLLLTLKFYY